MTEFVVDFYSEHDGVRCEQVVRCRDCRHYYECEEYSPHGNYVRRCCEYFDSYSDDVTPDGFCAWGERRDA